MPGLSMLLLLLLAGAAEEEEVKEEDLRPSVEVTVEASRLEGKTVRADSLPQPTLVITQEDIRKSSATSVSEILSEYPEVVWYDNVGNGREAIIDLRGFNEGTATAVFLDGTRINEPDSNFSLMTQIPLEWIDRIEVFKGSSSAVVGGGALSGSIRIYTNEGAGRKYLTAGGGSSGTGEARGEYSGGSNESSYRLGGGYYRSSGFRENGESREAWGLASYRHLSDAGVTNLRYSYADSRYGAPGSLLESELEQDRWASPYNKPDENGYETHLFSADIKREFAPLTLSGNAFLRDNRIDLLTTGRNAALFGGFTTDTRNLTTGGAFQVIAPIAGDDFSLSAGADLSYASVEADGFYTTAEGVTTTQASSTDSSESRQAAFVQAESVLSNLTLVAALRYDHSSVHYTDLLDNARKDDTSFGDASFNLGASYEYVPGARIFINGGTAFQTPTLTDLFAYPMFGSNPDLKPSKARDIEVGHRVSLGSFSSQISVYDLAVRDEVIYVIIDPIYFIGRNENAGKSRRRGVDIAASWRPTKKTFVGGGFSYLDAVFTAGDYDGKSLVMLPRQKFHIDVSQKLRDDLEISGRLLYVGERYLVGDEANTADKIPSYTTLDLKARYTKKSWSAEFTLQNVLDSEYETWGIISSWTQTAYYIPGAPIRALLTFSIRAGAE